jgi:heme/copper-type cytochrome/quinol oxidase subunit 1
MAHPAPQQKTKIFPYSLVGIGFLVLGTLCCTLGIVLGAMGIDIHFTKTYFVIGNFHWLSVFGLACTIAGIVTLARSLYARFIGS